MELDIAMGFYRFFYVSDIPRSYSEQVTYLSAFTPYLPNHCAPRRCGSKMRQHFPDSFNLVRSAPDNFFPINIFDLVFTQDYPLLSVFFILPPTILPNLYHACASRYGNRLWR